MPGLIPPPPRRPPLASNATNLGPAISRTFEIFARYFQPLTDTHPRIPEILAVSSEWDKPPGLSIPSAARTRATMSTLHQIEANRHTPKIHQPHLFHVQPQNRRPRQVPRPPLREEYPLGRAAGNRPRVLTRRCHLFRSSKPMSIVPNSSIPNHFPRKMGSFGKPRRRPAPAAGRSPEPRSPRAQPRRRPPSIAHDSRHAIMTDGRGWMPSWRHQSGRYN